MDLLTYILNSLPTLNKEFRRFHFLWADVDEARIAYFYYSEMYDLIEAPNVAALAEKIPAFLKEKGIDYPPFVA